MKSIYTALLISFTLLCPSLSYGFVKNKSTVPVTPTKPAGLITSDVAARAHSDVQVRRLLKLFAAKKLDSSQLYDRLKEIRPRRR